MEWIGRADIWNLKGEKQRFVTESISRQNRARKRQKDYFRPAKPTPSIYDSDLKRVAVYARVSTSSEEQISSIENQTLYYTKKDCRNGKLEFAGYLQR